MSASGKQIQTNPKAAWYDYGRQTFPFFSATSKVAALADAQAWVCEVLGEGGPWKRNRFGDYVPALIAKAYPLRKT